MEHRMRDLELIEERDVADGRQLGTIIMATVAFLGLSAAVGVVVGRAAQPEDSAPSRDPLAELQSGSPLKSGAAEEVPEAPKVDATTLTFPAALTGKEERPEVLAALAATAPGEAHLDHVLAAELAAEAPSAEDTGARLAKSVPAYLAAGPTQRALVQAAQHDPLIEASLPKSEPSTVEKAPVGEEGEFNLQVISYETEAEAEAFAEALREKGHGAFVMVADIPDRGRYYRVRIGPFESRWRANIYRKKFEAAEQMNTFVVKRPKEEDDK